MREMSIITDYKPLAAILKKILLRKHQCRVKIIYKPRPDLFIADWLSRQNSNENKDAEIPGIQLNINEIQTATNIPVYMKMHELQQTTSQDQNLQHCQDYIIQGWPESRDQMPQDIRKY